LREKLFGDVQQVVVGNQPGHHAPVKRLLRGQRAPGEHQVLRADRADQARQHLAVVGVGDATKQLGHPESGPIADHGEVTAHGDLQTTTLTQPVDRRHDRFGRLPQDVEGRHVHSHGGGEVHPVVLGGLSQIATGREDITGSGDEQAREVGIRIDPADRVPDAEVHRGCHRVARLRTVQGADRKRAFAFKAQERGAQPIAVGRTGTAIEAIGHVGIPSRASIVSPESK
jgi:hypothetical protein